MRVMLRILLAAADEDDSEEDDANKSFGAMFY